MIELRNSIITELPSVDGRRRFKAVCHQNAVQYKNLSGHWLDIDATYEESDGTNIKFTQTPFLVTVGEDSGRRIYPNKYDLSYWIEFGKPFANMGLPSRQDGWFYWNFTNAILGVKVINDGVKFGFRLKNSLAPTNITLPFTSQGITRQGELLYHNGEIVGYLKRPVATGSNFDVDGIPVRKDCDIEFNPGSVTISLDPTGLTYPIEIDPTYQVAASLDDAYEKENTGNTNVTDTTIYITSRTGGDRYFGGFRWAVAIPQGSTINSAYPTFYVFNASADDANLNLFHEYKATPAAFTAGVANYDITTRTKTATSASWVQQIIAAGGAGWYDGPSTVTPLQEVVDDFTTVYIGLIAIGNVNITRSLYVYPWDYDDNSYGAKFTVTWTEPSGVSVPIMSDNEINSTIFGGQLVR